MFGLNRTLTILQTLETKHNYKELTVWKDTEIRNRIFVRYIFSLLERG